MASAARETSQPLYGQTLPSGPRIGYNFASFLLGRMTARPSATPSNPQYRRSAWGFFVQDTWKITRKLTLDYGLRYDLQNADAGTVEPHQHIQPEHSQSQRQRPARRRALQGPGPGRCDCTWSTPIRTPSRRASASPTRSRRKPCCARAGASAYASVAALQLHRRRQQPGHGLQHHQLHLARQRCSRGPDIRSRLVWDQSALYGASYNPGLLVTPGAAVQNAPAAVDPNGGRPPRINQWNISLQREVTKDLVARSLLCRQSRRVASVRRTT